MSRQQGNNNNVQSASVLGPLEVSERDRSDCSEATQELQSVLPPPRALSQLAPLAGRVSHAHTRLSFTLASVPTSTLGSAVEVCVLGGGMAHHSLTERRICCAHEAWTEPVFM